MDYSLVNLATLSNKKFIEVYQSAAFLQPAWVAYTEYTAFDF